MTRHDRWRRGLLLLALAAAACSESGPSGPASNRAPQIRRVTVVPPVVVRGGTATITVDASDADGDTLFYRYEAQGGSITAEAADSPRAVYRNDGMERTSDEITVTVLDASSAVTTATAVVSLQANRAPRVEIVTGTTSCHPPCSLDLRAEVSDPDEDELTVVWSGCASGGGLSARCNVAHVGEVNASVSVQDGRGGVRVATVSLHGTNNSPVVSGGRTSYGGSGLLAPAFGDPNSDPMMCGWLGTCTCQGSGLVYQLQCSVPYGASSCSMRLACTDAFGATGETHYYIYR